MEAQMKNLKQYSLYELVDATIESNNGELARVICSMIFMPAIADFSLKSEFWLDLENPGYIGEGYSGFQDLSDDGQEDNAIQAEDFLRLLPEKERNNSKWAPIVALTIGACESVQDTHSKGVTTSWEDVLKQLKEEMWWNSRHAIRQAGYTHQKSRLVAAKIGQAKPPWSKLWTVEPETRGIPPLSTSADGSIATSDRAFSAVESAVTQEEPLNAFDQAAWETLSALPESSMPFSFCSAAFPSAAAK
jgi:hypothetical protein